MRQILRRLTEAEGPLKLSLTPGRMGWLLTSPLPLELLTKRVGGFCRRVTLIHCGAERSRYHLEPDWGRLGERLLENKCLRLHLSNCPRRRERLRRLALHLPLLRTGSGDPRARNPLFCRLALRLEALTQEGEMGGALSRHLGDDFDLLWREVPLYALRLTRFQKSVLRVLIAGCRDISRRHGECTRMATKILFFAALSEAVGVDETSLELSKALSVQDLVERLEEDYPALRRFERSYRVAVNQVFARDDELVTPGDEIALIPPVSGGDEPRLRAAVTGEELDMSKIAREVMTGRCGAVVTFMGTVRDLTGSQVTEHLHYTAYTEMAEKELLGVCLEAAERWDLGGAVVEHRVGELQPGDIAVVACCSAPHRNEAFEAARFLIDTTKERVPIWKKEFGPDGASWV